MPSNVLDWLQQYLGGGQAPAPTDPLGQLLARTGDPEAQASAAASQAMEPVVGPYLNRVASGAMTGESLREGLQSVNDAFATHDYPGLAGMFGGGAIKAYHGSPLADLSVIKASPPVRQFDNATSQFGAFFSPTKYVARRYAGEGGRVYEANLDLQNPYDMAWKDFNYFQSPHKTALGDLIPGEQWGSRAEELKQEAAGFRDALASVGHDAVIVKNPRTGEPMEISSFKDVAEILRKFGLAGPVTSGAAATMSGEK